MGPVTGTVAGTAAGVRNPPLFHLMSTHRPKSDTMSLERLGRIIEIVQQMFAV